MGNFEAWFARSYKGVIVALVAVMAVALTVLALQHVDSSRATAREPLPIPTYGADSAQETAAFLGDSYTAGTGASPTSKRWTTLLSEEEGWQELNDGAGGTGYVVTASEDGCGKSFCDNYLGRVGEVVKQDPDVVVVAGGQNDFAKYQTDPDAVRENIGKVFDELHEKLPAAKIIAVGPSTTSDIAPQVTGLDDAVRESASKVGAQYISLLDPNVIEQSWVTADGGHVNNDGHAAIAKRIAEALA